MLLAGVSNTGAEAASGAGAGAGSNSTGVDGVDGTAVDHASITGGSVSASGPRRQFLITKAEKRALELQQQQQQQQQLALVQQQQRFMYGPQAVSPVPIAGYDQYGRPVAAYAPPAGYYGAPDMRMMVPTYSVSPYDLL